MEETWTLLEAKVVYTGGETSDWPENVSPCVVVVCFPGLGVMDKVARMFCFVLFTIQVVDLSVPEQLKTWVSNTSGDLPCGMEQVVSASLMEAGPVILLLWRIKTEPDVVLCFALFFLSALFRKSR